MYLLMGIGISNIEVIKKLKQLKKDFIITCKKEEIEKANKYHNNVISYECIKYLNFDKIKYVIKSPGIPYYDKYVLYLKSKRLKVINEIELTYILTNKKGIYIGVSGSVGKSSVVTLLYNQIKSNTDNVLLAGNIGTPLISYMDKINNDTIIILEVSSFQLDDFNNIKFHIALLTNIYDNHLDVYKNKERYYLSKFKLTNKQNKNDYFIVNLDNEITRKYIINHKFNSRLIDYKLGFNIKNDVIYYYNEQVTDLKYYFLQGNHNLDNLKSVIVILSLLKIKLNIKVLEKESPLKYHLQQRMIKDDIMVINDSKSTCINSLKSAIDTYKDRKIILLFGGYNKNLNFKFLQEYKFKYLICFGSLSNNIDKMINVDIKFNKLKDGIKFALNIATRGDIILFSPGCASFDEYSSYLKRGEAFDKYIEDYCNE